MKENNSLDTTLEQRLQNHYEECYGQPPDVAPFWTQLSPRLEKRVQRASWLQRQLNSLQRGISLQEETALSPEVSQGRIYTSKHRPGRTGTWVAALLAIIVVGSMLLVLNKAHGTLGQTAATHVSEVSDIYFATTPAEPIPTNGIGHSTGDPVATLSRMNKTTHTLLWQRSIKGLNSSLVTAGGIAYGTTFNTTTDRSTVIAVNLNDGSIRWDAAVGSPEFLTAPAVADGAVYVMKWTGQIYSLDSKNGKINWVYDTKLIPHMSGGLIRPGSVTVANGVLYNTVLNTLVAVDAKKGTLLWSKTIDNTLLFSSPVATGGAVYASSHTENGFGEGPNQSGFVYAYDAHSGTQKWVYSVATIITDTPIITNGRVIFGSAKGNFYALDPASGKKIWQYATGQDYSIAPVVADNIVYFQRFEGASRASAKPYLTALDLSTGKKLWQQETAVVANAGAVKDGTIYGGIAPHQLVALNTSNGSEIWHTDVTASGVPFVWLVA